MLHADTSDIFPKRAGASVPRTPQHLSNSTRCGRRGTDSLAVRRCWISFKKPGSLTQTIKHKTINIHFGIYFQQKPHQSKRPLLGSVWGPGAAPGLTAMGRAGREEQLFLRGSARRTWPQALPERLQQEASFLCCPLPPSFPQSSSSLAWPPAPAVPSTLCSSLVLRQLRDVGPGLCPWGCCCPVGLLLSCGASAVLWGAAAPWGCREPWLGLWQQHAARSTQRQGAPCVLFAKAQLWSAGEGTPLRAPRTNMYNAEAERGISFVRNHALTISCIHTVSAEFTSKSHAQEICSEAVWPVGLCIM